MLYSYLRKNKMLDSHELEPVPMGRSSLHVTGPSRSGTLRARLDLPDVRVGAMQTSLIQNAHADLVTDTAYDFYGVRLATCSLDHRIKIWQLDESDGTWTAVADWKVRVPLSHSPPATGEGDRGHVVRLTMRR